MDFFFFLGTVFVSDDNLDRMMLLYVCKSLFSYVKVSIFVICKDAVRYGPSAELCEL